MCVEGVAMRYRKELWSTQSLMLREAQRQDGPLHPLNVIQMSGWMNTHTHRVWKGLLLT